MNWRFALVILLVHALLPLDAIPVRSTVNIQSNPSPSNGDTRDYYLGVTATPRFVGNLTGEFTIGYAEDAYDEISSIGEYTVFDTGADWYDIPESLQDNGTLEIISWIDDYDLGVVLRTSFWNTSDIGGGLIRPTVSFPSDWPSNTAINDSQFVDAWIEHCENITEQVSPEFLVLGQTVNEFWGYSDNPHSVNNTFNDFLDLCEQATDAVHEIDSGVETIIEFDLQTVIDRNQWELIENITSSHCDIVGFTSYPYRHGSPIGTVYASPSDLPAGYYAQIENHTTVSLAFTSVGWSTGFMNDSYSNFTGSESGQEDFVEHFFSSVDNLSDVVLVVWNSLHDTMPVGNETDLNQMMGLNYYNGTNKSALDEWKDTFQRSYGDDDDSGDEDPSNDIIGYDPIFSWWMGLLFFGVTVVATVGAIYGLERWMQRKDRERCGCTGRPGCDCSI